MKNALLIIVIAFGFNKAMALGEDLPVLNEILRNSIQQLFLLKDTLDRARSEYEFIKHLNRGLDDTFVQVITRYPSAYPGLYEEWKNVNEAKGHLETIYGIVHDSKSAIVQKHTDRSVVEGITEHNHIHEYADQIDQAGEEVKLKSATASPQGAARLTAQSQGMMLQVMSESLRAQAKTLKLQSQQMAQENYNEKESSQFFMKSSRDLKNNMKSLNSSMKVPRF